MVEILFSSRNFLRETTTRVFSSVIVLAKGGNYSVIGFAGEHEFEKVVLNTALLLLMETYKPEFFVLFFQKNAQEYARRFSAVIVNPFGTSTCKVTETKAKEKHVIDEAENERGLDTR